MCERLTMRAGAILSHPGEYREKARHSLVHLPVVRSLRCDAGKRTEHEERGRATPADRASHSQSRGGDRIHGSRAAQFRRAQGGGRRRSTRSGEGVARLARVPCRTGSPVGHAATGETAYRTSAESQVAVSMLTRLPAWRGSPESRRYCACTLLQSPPCRWHGKCAP